MGLEPCLLAVSISAATGLRPSKGINGVDVRERSAVGPQRGRLAGCQC